MAEPTQLGKRLLELRKGHRMTQGALATAVGVSTNAISQFEKGNIRPSLETLSKLSTTLGEDLRALMPRIGAFPIASTEHNVKVPIVLGNQYNRLKWDYLRRDESALPDPATEANFALSATSYEYEALTLPPSMVEPGVHRIFPMPGNGMAPTFEDGDLMMFRLLDPSQLDEMDKDKFPTSTQETDAFSVYAVETQRPTGISMDFARFGLDTERKALVCYYDDRSYMHYIPLAEVKAVWKFEYVISKRSPNLAGKLYGLNYELGAAQKRIKQLEAELLKAQEEAAALRAQLPTTEEPAESPQPAPKPDSVPRKRAAKDVAPAGAAPAQAPGPSV